MLVLRTHSQVVAVIILLISGVILCQAVSALAETGSSREGRTEWFNLSGQAGLSTEHKWSPKQGSTLDSWSGYAYFNPTLELFEVLTISGNFVRSLRNSEEYRATGHLSLHPEWSWGSVQAGDFSESFSSLVLDGLVLEGVSVSINPGSLRMTFLRGVSPDRIYDPSSGSSYDRIIYGGKVGIGNESGSHLYLHLVRGFDEITSKSRVDEPRADTGDLSEFETSHTTGFSTESTPQECLTIGARSQLEMFSNRISLAGEIDGSAFTKDTRASVIRDHGLPKFVSRFFTPRVGSCLDLASRAELTVSSGGLTITSGYKYIGPGYASLGLANQVSDMQELSIGLTWRSRNHSFHIHAMRDSDNLLGQRELTTYGQKLSGSLRWQPATAWLTIVTGSVVNGTTESSARSIESVRNSRFATLQQAWRPSSGGILRRMAGTFTYQESSIDTRGSGDSYCRSYMLMVDTRTKPATRILINLRASTKVTLRSNLSSDRMSSGGLTATWELLPGKCTLTSSTDFTVSSGNAVVISDASLNFSIWSGCQLESCIRGSASMNRVDSSWQRDDLELSLSLNQRF